jgi:ABC-type antimicrobial peptide transport system permease subunit
MVPVIGQDQLLLGPEGIGMLASMDGIGAFTGAVLMAMFCRPSIYRHVYVGSVMLYMIMLTVFALVPVPLVAGLALLLACIGIYGVLAYLTGQRVSEIGVRMALGAGAREVIWLVLRQSIGMILIGVALGTAVAFAAALVLQRLVEGMQPVSASTFAITISVLLFAALLASCIPARRASRIDPVIALRQE